MEKEIIEKVMKELIHEFGFTYIKQAEFRFEKAIKLTIQKMEDEELDWLGKILVMDFSNIDKSEIKNLIKLRHIKKLK